MLKIEGKTFMNIQEAVQWLLENNALPFQCTANYQANTEIGLGTIVNPSPAKVRIGSLIFFVDSKVSTVVGITETGFICSDKYNNLVDDIAYVINVAINGSGHLITTLSDGQTIDAGIVKQVSGFSINASQHLIVTYNDGSTTDLGAIFSGNINIAGNLTADSIIENMAGYYFEKQQSADLLLEYIYAGAVKNGNKLTLALALNITRNNQLGGAQVLGVFTLPLSVANQLFPTSIGNYSLLAIGDATITMNGYETKVVQYQIVKNTAQTIGISLTNSSNLNTQFTQGDKYYIRLEATFLLSENLAS